MSYASHLTPRPETLSEGGIEEIIDLGNLADRRRRKIEARPDAFLSLTYPTAEIRRVIDRLNARFAGRRDTPALFLFEGLKGSGKSHLLVLAYHLLKNPNEASKWLSRHELSFGVPERGIVIAHKYTDRPLLRLWDHVFEQAGLRVRGPYDIYPSDAQILEAIGDRHLIIILDELEQGIRMISDEALRRQNIAFLQMLSELGLGEVAALLRSRPDLVLNPVFARIRITACPLRYLGLCKLQTEGWHRCGTLTFSGRSRRGWRRVECQRPDVTAWGWPRPPE